MAANYNDLPEKTLLRPDEVAAFLRISLKTVYRWCNRGLLEGIRLGGSLRIYRKSILKFMQDKEGSHKPR